MAELSIFNPPPPPQPRLLLVLDQSLMVSVDGVTHHVYLLIYKAGSVFTACFH